MNCWGSLKKVIHLYISQMKMNIYRPNNIEYSTIEVDLIKKPGKGLGLSVVARKSGKGVYIADIVSYYCLKHVWVTFDKLFMPLFGFTFCMHAK